MDRPEHPGRPGGPPRGWAAIRASFGELDRSHWILLLLLGSTTFFDGYDRGIVLLALKQIRETFSLSQSGASWYLGLLYLGALPAVPLTRKADSIGRRKLLVLSILGYTVATGLTAVSPNAPVFASCQFVAKFFLNAEAAIVWTMAAEELPAKARGLGFGWLAMNSALGVGFGAILFGGIFHPLGISWRWLYVVGIPPLFLVSWLRRRLPESRRFLVAQQAGKLASSWRAIFRPPHRRWLLLILTVGFLTQLVTQAGSFAIDFLQTQRGLSTSTASFMVVAAGLPGIPIMVAGGALSDRYGRRVVGCAFALLGVVGALAFFWLPGGVAVLLPAMCLTLVGQLAANPTFNSYVAELFSTSVRSQAAAWSTVAQVTGQAVSFGLAGLLLVYFSFSVTTSVLVLGPIAAVVIFWTRFPDTHGRELEDISGDEPLGAATAATGAPPGRV